MAKAQRIQVDEEAHLHDLPAVGPPALQGVRVAGVLEFSEQGYEFRASSLPGHLIHLMISGRVRQEQNGRWYETQPGYAVWYHEDEHVCGQVLEAPWVFYTVSFVAPSLSPPSYESRVRALGADGMIGGRVQRQFESLVSAWRDLGVAPAVRELRVQAKLLELLSMIWSADGQLFSTDPAAQLWWDLETRLRQDLRRPINFSLMQDLCGKSRASIARSCMAAVGMSPMRRVRQVRLSFARGLVRHSDLRLKEIADRVGYGRLHEFSRDYRKHFGCPAREDRSAARRHG